MKKLLLSLIFIFSMLFFTNSVYADSFSATFAGDSSFTNEITITLQISNYQDNSSSCQGICAFSADYNYDSSKIELVSITALNDFRLTQGNGTVVLSRSTGVGNGSGLISLTFKNKGLNDGEETTFSMTNLNASNGDDDITGNNVSKTIKYVAPPKPSNSSSDSTTSSNNNTNSNNNQSNTKEDTKKATSSSEKKSNNADLKEITISSGEFKFSKDILNYNVVVDKTIDSITIDAKTEDTKAKITGTGKHDLVIGDNKIELEVTAEDGTKKTYTINVTKDDDAEPIIEPTIGVEDTTTKQNNNPLLPYLIMAIVLAVILLAIIIYLLMKKKSNQTSQFDN